MADRKTNRRKRKREDRKPDEHYYRYVDDRISLLDNTKEMSFCKNFIRDFLLLYVDDDILIETGPMEINLLLYYVFSILLEYHDCNSQ